MKEIWKSIPIKGLKDVYEISNFGLIRNIKTKKIMPRNIRSAYPNFTYTIKQNNKCEIKNIKIHRLVAKVFIENDDPENKIWINHINGDKLDCRSSNLEWVTPSYNTQHALDNGLNMH